MALTCAIVVTLVSVEAHCERAWKSVTPRSSCRIVERGLSQRSALAPGALGVSVDSTQTALRSVGSTLVLSQHKLRWPWPGPVFASTP